MAVVFKMWRPVEIECCSPGYTALWYKKSRCPCWCEDLLCDKKPSMEMQLDPKEQGLKFPPWELTPQHPSLLCIPSSRWEFGSERRALWGRGFLCHVAWVSLLSHLSGSYPWGSRGLLGESDHLDSYKFRILPRVLRKFSLCATSIAWKIYWR